MSIQISALTSPRTGSPVVNQLEVITDKGRFFQSYSTVVAKIDNKGKVTLDDCWGDTQTTLRYLKEFLYTNETKQDFRNRIESGEYKIAKKAIEIK